MKTIALWVKQVMFCERFSKRDGQNNSVEVVSRLSSLMCHCKYDDVKEKTDTIISRISPSAPAILGLNENWFIVLCV